MYSIYLHIILYIYYTISLLSFVYVLRVEIERNDKNMTKADLMNVVGRKIQKSVIVAQNTNEEACEGNGLLKFFKVTKIILKI